MILRGESRYESRFNEARFEELASDWQKSINSRLPEGVRVTVYNPGTTLRIDYGRRSGRESLVEPWDIARDYVDFLSRMRIRLPKRIHVQVYDADKDLFYDREYADLMHDAFRRSVP